MDRLEDADPDDAEMNGYDACIAREIVEDVTATLDALTEKVGKNPDATRAHLGAGA